MQEKIGMLKRIDIIAVKIGVIGNIGGAIMIALMTGLVTIDVLGRFILGMPTYIATEFSGYLMAAMVFLGLARISRIGKQIEVTVVIDRLPVRLSRWIRFATLTVSFVFIVWFCILTIGPVMQNIDFNSTSITPIKTPMWIPTIFLPIGLAMLSIELFSQWLRQVIEIIAFGQPYAATADEAEI